jgi:AbrB family looped-hinge helix DNA binding protein
MSKSLITSRHQTTIPKDVREKLGIGPGDVLQWEILEDGVRVTVTSRAFLRLRGTFKVGPGDPVEDVRRARKLIGNEGLG